MTNNRPIKKLGEISLRINDGNYGNDYPKSNEFIQSGIPFITAKNIGNNGEIKYESLLFISRDKHLTLKKAQITVGDVILVNRGVKEGLINIASIISDNKFIDANISPQLTRIRVNTDILFNKYLYYFFYSTNFKKTFDQITKGSALKFINLTQTQNIQIPLPPLDIQKAIVAKLDETFTKIDEAISTTQTNIAKTNEIPHGFLRKKFEELEKTYEIFPLLKYVDFIGGSQPEKKFFSYVPKEGYVRLIQIRDYKSENNLTYIDKNSTKKFCESDDIMIGRYGPPVFQILRGLKGAYNVALMKAIPNENMLTKDYLFWFLQNPNIQNYIINISQRSAGQSGVNKEALEKYNIPLPPLANQTEIVKYLEEVFAETSELKSQYQNKLRELKELKASILQSAFEGKLI